MTTPTIRPIGAPQLGARVRKRRQRLGLTLQALGESAGVSVGYLSQVERDKAVPTLGTLAQIAQALDVGLEFFIAAARPADALSRAEGRERFAVAGSSVVYESLSADYPGSEMSSYILHVPPGYASETVAHDGEEIIVILEGEIEQSLGGEILVMRIGDALHYNGATPHSWANRQSSPARILWTGKLGVLRRDGDRARPQVVAANDNPGTGRTDETERD